MYTSGGLAQDPNKRDAEVREKRRRKERMASRAIMAAMAIALACSLAVAIFAAIKGNIEYLRLAIGSIGASGFLFGCGYVGYRVSLNA